MKYQVSDIFDVDSNQVPGPPNIDVGFGLVLGGGAGLCKPGTAGGGSILMWQAQGHLRVRSTSQSEM